MLGLNLTLGAVGAVGAGAMGYFMHDLLNVPVLASGLVQGALFQNVLTMWSQRFIVDPTNTKTQVTDPAAAGQRLDWEMKEAVVATVLTSVAIGTAVMYFARRATLYDSAMVGAGGAAAIYGYLAMQN